MLNILEIRDRLNLLPFQNGKRQVSIGRISDQIEGARRCFDAADEDDETAEAIELEIATYLAGLREELAVHDLLLDRDPDDPDLLYAVQPLRPQRQIDLTWLAEGLNWVSRITTVALEMVLPAVVGYWIDKNWGTKFAALVGLGLGVPLGIWHLLQMLSADRSDRRNKPGDQPP